MTAPGADVLATEYLYAIESEHYEGDDNHCYVPARVVSFRITRKTPRRIYYVRGGSSVLPEIGYVDRQKIEADGEIYKRGSGWWERDFHLHLAAPEIEQHRKPTLAELKAAMRAAHPDAGGSHETFIKAREAYEHARAASDSRASSAGHQTTPREGDRVT